MSGTTQPSKHVPMLTKRFQQAVLFTVYMLLMATISSFYFNEAFTLKFLLVLDALTMLALFPLVSKGKIDLAKQLFLWTNLIVLSYIFYEKGGLLSPSLILIYPIFLMVSALLVGPRTFFVVYSFILGLVILYSVHAINSHTNYSFKLFGYWDLSIIIILLTAAGFTAWRFNGDMRYTIKKLKKEVANVKQSNTEKERLIHFDSLTGLSSKLNAQKQFNLLNQEMDRSSEEIYFLSLDLDNFKSINDYYNHDAGDIVLKLVANRIQSLSEKKDIVCRLSADEFLIIACRYKGSNIENLSKCVLDQISQPVLIHNNSVDISASLGIATYDDKIDMSFESVLKRADLAMDRAKQSGKNTFYLYDDELSRKSSRKLRIIKGLKTALKNNDLELFLQPKVNINSGKIESAEALIRWVRNNPENYSPAEFIPLIESTELICKVGEWVIGSACSMCKKLHNKGYDNLSISINISSAQFVMGGLENIIIRELQASGLEPKYIELELTEHIIFQDDKDVLEELSRIKELGVTLSIDDFGTGYSNLGYLTKFKVDTLKIDRSFVTDIDHSSNNLAIVDAIIKMASTLGLNVVAEGVETQQEWNVLKQLGCDQGQGYIWSKPLTTNGFLQYMAESTQV